MANKIEPKAWLERQWQHIERDWDKYENLIQIAFVIAGIIFPIVFTIGIGEGNHLNPLIGILTMISFWTIALTSALLIRNAGKGTKERLNDIDNDIKDLKTSIGELLTLIQREHDERNKPK